MCAVKRHHPEPGQTAGPVHQSNMNIMGLTSPTGTVHEDPFTLKGLRIRDAILYYDVRITSVCLLLIEVARACTGLEHPFSYT